MSRRKRNNNGRFSLFAFQDIITCIMGIMLLLTLIMCLQISTTMGTTGAPDTAAIVQRMQQQSIELTAEVSRLETEVGVQLNQLNAGAISDVSLLKQRMQHLDDDNQRAQQRVRNLWEQKANADASLTRLRETNQQNQNRPQLTQQLQQQNAQLKEQLEQMRQGDRVVYNAHDSATAECWLVELAGTSSFQAALIGQKQKPLTFSSHAALKSWIEKQHRRGAAFLLLIRPAAADMLEVFAEELRQQNVVFGFDLLPPDTVAIDPVTGASIK
jgi:hypothetical protein